VLGCQLLEHPEHQTLEEVEDGKYNCRGDGRDIPASHNPDDNGKADECQNYRHNKAKSDPEGARLIAGDDDAAVVILGAKYCVLREAEGMAKRGRPAVACGEVVRVPRLGQEQVDGPHVAA